jgi:hypothetical protein
MRRINRMNCFLHRITCRFTTNPIIRGSPPSQASASAVSIIAIQVDTIIRGITTRIATITHAVIIPQATFTAGTGIHLSSVEDN